MNKEVLILNELRGINFIIHYSKYSIDIDNVNIDKILLSNKVCFDKRVIDR